MGWNPFGDDGWLSKGLNNIFAGRHDENPYKIEGGPGTRGTRLESGRASRFANQGEQGFGQLGQESEAVRRRLGRVARGKDSISAEQLRQGLQQNVAGQQAMAAGARGGNSGMASRNAMRNAASMGSGMAGQQALAGIAERQAADQSLGNMIGQQRQMELQAALGGRGQALQGYGQLVDANASRYGSFMNTPTGRENQRNFAFNSLGSLGLSDRTKKTNIKSGSAGAKEFLEGIKAYSYDYKDEKFGKGPQVGVMAQDLERSKAGRQAVVETPHGKMVDAAKLAGALAAATSYIDKRVSKLEGKGK